MGSVNICIFVTIDCSQMVKPLRSVLALPIDEIQYILEWFIFIFQLNVKIINDKKYVAKQKI